MKCELCGKEFKRLGLHLCNKHNMNKEQQKEYYDKYLKKENEGVCQECGKPTLFIDFAKGYRPFCSPKCSNSNKDKIDKTKQVFIDRYGVDSPFKYPEFKEKIKNTNLERYGVESPSQSEEVQEKTKRTNLERYGTEHAISSDVVRDKIKNTNIERYGVDNPWKSEEVKDKIKKTNLDKYGVENPLQAEEIKTKARETNLKKYGFENPAQAEEIQTKIRETTLERYGVENIFQLDWVKEKANVKAKLEGKKYYVETEDFKEKSKNTSLEKYGTEHPMQSEEILDRMRKTNLDRYGTEYVLSDPEIRKKIEATNLEKYGVKKIGHSKDIRVKIEATNLERYGYDCIFKSPEFKDRIANTNRQKYGSKIYPQSHIEHIEEWENFEEFLRSNNSKYNSIELSEYFNSGHKSVRSRAIKLGLQDYIKDFYSLSQPEMQFKQLLDSRIPNVKYVMHDRQTIATLELDFYFPEQNLAVEISPVYTHQYISEETEDFIMGVTDKEYHYNKFRLCEEKGIELITIFDWEDINRIVDLIEDKLQPSPNVVYARKCTINYLGSVNNSHKDFLSKYHVLGLVNNKKDSFVLELIYQGEVLGIAVYYPYKNGQLELKRLAFKDGCTIIGGASKLVKNAFKYKPDITSVVTFSDNNLGTGSVYKTIGFELIEDNKYSCTYYNSQYEWAIKETSLWLQGADRLLKNFPGYEPVGIGDDLPKNDEIVMSYGFVPVYDCGYRKWVYNRE